MGSPGQANGRGTEVPHEIQLSRHHMYRRLQVRERTFELHVRRCMLHVFILRDTKCTNAVAIYRLFDDANASECIVELV